MEYSGSRACMTYHVGCKVEVQLHTPIGSASQLTCFLTLLQKSCVICNMLVRSKETRQAGKTMPFAGRLGLINPFYSSSLTKRRITFLVFGVLTVVLDIFHSDLEYNELLYVNISFKWSLCFGPEWY